mgnify:CR=1 FL=1|jgi:hypothetical protein
MGATWWLANHDGSIGEAQVAKPAFAHALRFYKSLIELGGADAATASYLTCLQLYKEGKVSIWCGTAALHRTYTALTPHYTALQRPPRWVWRP